MDVYRIGTLLEMVREMAYQLAEDGKLVKVCVQQSMGQGVFQVSVLHHQHVCQCIFMPSKWRSQT